MAGPRIRRGDTVEVISGKEKGKTGTVKTVEPKKNRVFVEGLNMQTRHRRARTMQQANVEGVTHQEGPIHISNVMLVDPNSNSPTRVQITRGDDGKRKRVAKKSGQEID